LLTVRVHGVGKPQHPLEPARLEVQTLSQRSHDLCEALKVCMLHDEREALEKWNDHSFQRG
jgi:hypothetical protein